MILIRPWGKGKEKGWAPLFTGELGRNLTRERAWREWRRSLEGCPRSRLAFFCYSPRRWTMKVEEPGPEGRPIGCAGKRVRYPYPRPFTLSGKRVSGR